MEIRNLNGAEMNSKALLTYLKRARSASKDQEAIRLLSIAITDLEKSLWAIEKANKIDPDIEWTNPPVQYFS